MKHLIGYFSIFIIVISLHSTLVSLAQSNWLFESVFFRSREGGPVYPGSSGASLTIILRFTGSQALYPLACVEPQYPFSVEAKCSPLMNSSGEPVNRVERGEVLNIVFTFNVDRGAQPGEYNLPIKISYNDENNYIEEEFAVTLTVEAYPKPSLTIIETYFTPYGYPGSYPASLVVKMRNDGNVSIESLDVEALFQRYINPVSARSSVTYRIEPGQVFNIVFNGLAVDPYAQPGAYSLLLSINGSFRTADNVLYDYSLQISSSYVIDPSPSVNLKVLNHKFTADVVLPGLHNTGVNFVIQSLESGVVNIYAINVSLINAIFINGSNSDLIPANALLNYGDVVELSITGIDIGLESFVKVNIDLLVSIDKEGSTYFSLFNFTLFLPIPAVELNITVLSSDWINTRALPGSTGLELSIILANDEPVALRNVYAKLKLSDVFSPSTMIIYGLQIGPYSLAELTYTDISVTDSAEPGWYKASLELTCYLANSDGSTKAITLLFSNIMMRIESFEEINSFIPNVEVDSFYWGELAPAHVYPGNSRAPLTLILRNSGIYGVQNVHVGLVSSDYSIEVLNPVVKCSNILSPSDSCQAVFYLNLANTFSGLKSFIVSISYIVPDLGSMRTFQNVRNITVFLPKPDMEIGVELVSYGWLNNYPAYPNSRRAVLTLSFTNNELYTVQGVWVNLSLPPHFKAIGGFDSLIYVAGPIPSFQVFTVDYHVDIGAVDPGSHEAYVTINYIIQTFGFVKTKPRTYVLRLDISDPSLSLAIVRHGWYGSAPINGTRGYNYIFIVRNREFPSINNPMLKLELPRGLYDPLTGLNTIYAYPIGMIPSIQIPETVLTQIPITQLQQLLSGMSREESISKGDYAVFTLTIGFEPLVEKSVYANVSLVFIDHWGYEYVIKDTIEILLTVQPPQLFIEPLTPLVYFVNGTSYLDLGLFNPGDGDLYEVYVILIPASGNAIPQGNVRFINKIASKETRSVRYTLIYNPITISGLGEFHSSSIVFTVSVMYRDYLGYIKMINQTIAVLPKPFIEVSISQDTTAKLVGEKLVVNGLIINTGLNKARSVLATLTYGNASTTYVIGDIDPSSQLPFRLELYVKNRGLRICDLTVSYIDEFNTRYVKTYKINVTFVEEPEPKEVETAHPVTVFYVFTVLATIIFLAGVFVLIYRYLTSRLKTGVKT